MRKTGHDEFEAISTTTIKIPFFTGKIKTIRRIKLQKSENNTRIMLRENHRITKYLLGLRMERIVRESKQVQTELFTELGFTIKED